MSYWETWSAEGCFENTEVSTVGRHRIPKQALQYKPKAGRKVGRLRKRRKGQLHFES